MGVSKAWNPPVRIVIRGFGPHGIRVFEDVVTLNSEAEIEVFLPGLAEKHALALANYAMHMIEVEFLDETDPSQRFFRFGTDPGGMLLPIEIRTGSDDGNGH
jgi:hypothetical protein